MDSFTENILSRARQRANLLTTQHEDNEETEIETPKTKVLSQQNANTKTNIKPPLTKKSPNQGSPKNSPQKTRTLCFQKENLNMEIKLTSSDNVRVEVEFEDDDEKPTSNGAGLRKDVKDRLNRLGKLYAGGDDAELSSPIHRTEEKFMTECRSDDTPLASKNGGKFLKGLANLAEEMNQWEDEVKSSSKKKEKETLKWDKSVLESLESQGFQRKAKETKLVYDYSGKKEKEEKKGSETVKNKEVKKLDIAKRYPMSEVAKTPDEKNSSFLKKDPSSLSISERKALFERNQGEVLLPKAPFAMSVPLNDKNNKSKSNNSPVVRPEAKSNAQDNGNKKIVTFENVKLKKVKTDENSPRAPKIVEESWKPSVESAKKKFDAPSAKVESNSGAKKAENSSRATKVAKTDQTSPKVGLQQSGGIASTVEALFKKSNTISERNIQSQVKEQRMKEMEVLLNRFKRKEVQEDVIEEADESDEEEEECSDTDPMLSRANEKTRSPAEVVNREDLHVESAALKRVTQEKDNDVFQSPRRSGGKRSSVSPRVAAVLEDVKRIKVSPAKPGRIYPSLSDIEATRDTETEDGTEPSSPENSSIASYSGTLETSFGKEILDAVCKNQTPVKRAIYDDSTASDVSDVLGDMEEYLEEAEYDQDRDSMGPTPPKVTKSKDSSFASHSFNYKNFSAAEKSFKSPMKCKRESNERKEEAPVEIVEGNEVVPLTYTVSFYRKQTNNVASPSPMKVVSRNEEPPCPEPDKQQEILAKIKFLQAEVQKLQLIIAQTSQALNLCNNTLEFMGSTEQVEAEKVLLVSTHRRQAILNEIQRLKVEETFRPQNHNFQEIPIEKGSLTISDIVLPLKKDYVRALAAAGGKGHHVVCLVKSGEEVVSSKLVSTVASNMKNPCYELSIPGSVTLKNIYNDSTITLEVYCLQAQEEFLPHEVKYHITKKSKATPKKSKHESLLSRPVKESPGGPQAVRSPSFALMGYVVFSVHKMNRKSWSLNNTPSMSPLEGSVEMIVSCELTASVEYRGFLTMFEDISGFGAWHRRWCLLKGDSLSYWKYPDDEKSMPPIDSIDLKSCITKEVGPVSRDICARLHTFLIETKRDPLPQDKETLTTICKKDKTIIRHLLSADTKEERIKWCSQFNTVLLANKICGNNA